MSQGDRLPWQEQESDWGNPPRQEQETDQGDPLPAQEQEADRGDPLPAQEQEADQGEPVSQGDQPSGQEQEAGPGGLSQQEEPGQNWAVFILSDSADSEPPVILVNSKCHRENNYCSVGDQEVTLTVTDNEGLRDVLIGNRELEGLDEGAASFTCPMPVGANQTVTAVDMAGNQSSLTVNVQGSHSYERFYAVQEASCEDRPGTGVIDVCKNCGATYKMLLRPTGPALGHDYRTETWTVNGQTVSVEVCSRCGMLKDGEVFGGEHHWADAPTVDVEPTCTKDGSSSVHCLDEGCGARKDVTFIPAYTHRYGAYEILVASTCTEGGSRQRTCQICGDVVKENTQPMGHSWRGANDCTKPVECSRCGEVQAQAAYTEHNFGGEIEGGLYDHWQNCQNLGCTQKLRSQHTLLAADGDCTRGRKCSVCGYTVSGASRHRMGYVSDAEGHWMACLTPGCSFKDDGSKEKHKGFDDANCVTPIYCKECGYMIQAGNPEHDLSGGYEYDNMVHYLHCRTEGCIYSTPSEAHHTAAAGDDCTKPVTCDTCGYQMKAGNKAHNVVVIAPWKKDKTSHWKDCINPGCDARANEALHDSGVVVEENVREASCEEPRTYEKVTKCNVCGEEISRETVTEGSALGHSWGEKKVIDEADSCVDGGFWERTCTVCGKTETGEFQNPDAHDWENEFTVDKEPTCDQEGSQSIHCANCSAVKDSEVIPAKGHTYGEWQVETAASCETDGTESRVCTVCGKDSSRQTQVLAALGHSWEDTYTTDVNPGCLEEGRESIRCGVCGKVREESERVIPALGHTMGEWEEILSPDCDDSGSRRRSCQVCGWTETEIVNPNGHAWLGEYTVDRQPTCTEDGSMSLHCANCSAVEDSREIPARGHSFGEWEHVDSPTCDAAGSEKRICSVCGFQETRHVNPEGHDWQLGYTVDVPASCTADGSMSIHCRKCDAVKESTVLPALGHSFTRYVPEGDGTETAECDNGCGQKDVRRDSVAVEDETRNEVAADLAALDLEEILEANGLDRYSQKVEIVLTQSTPADSDSQELKQAAEAYASYELAGIYEVDLVLWVDGNAVKELTEGFGSLTVSFRVGSELAGRKAVVYQKHEESILPPYTGLTVSGDGTVTVTVNMLSSFAVIVEGETEPSPEPTAEPSPEPTEAPAAEPTAEPAPAPTPAPAPAPAPQEQEMTPEAPAPLAPSAIPLPEGTPAPAPMATLPKTWDPAGMWTAALAADALLLAALAGGALRRRKRKDD